jgi:hypothetical protein
MEHVSMAVSQSDEVANFGIVGATSTFGIQVYGTLGFDVFDATGNPISSIQFQGKGAISDILEANGSYYVAGQYLDSLEFPGLPTLSTNGQPEPRGGFVGKFDASGNPVWVNDLNIVSAGLVCTSLSVGASGNIVVGTFPLSGGAFGGVSALLHFSDNGVLTETWNMNGLGTVASVSTNANGYVAFSGSCAADSLELNGHLVTAINDYNQVYGLFDATGNLIWFKSVLDVTCVFPSIHLDDNNCTYFCAESFIQADLDGIPILPGNWVYSFFVGKVNGMGTTEWVFQSVPDSIIVGDSERSFVRQIGNPNGGVTINGRTRGTVNWGNGITSGVGLPESDLFSLTIDATGNAVNVRSSGIGSWAKKNISSLPNPSGTHTYMLTVNMDTLHVPGLSVPATGMNLFLSKWSNTTAGIVDNPKTTTEHFPDPATNTINLSGLSNATTVVFHDLTGRVSARLPARYGMVDVSILRPGTYVMTCWHEDNPFYRSTVRIIR